MPTKKTLFGHIDEVVPNDGADLPGGEANGLLVWEPGDVRVTLRDGKPLTLRCVRGDVIPLFVKRVHCSGTTSAQILAFYE